VYGANVIVEEEQGGEGEGGALLLQSVDMGYLVTYGLAAKQVCVRNGGRERERERERKRARKCVSVCVCVCVIGGYCIAIKQACVCACERQRWHVRVRTCAREKERAYMSVRE